MTDTTTTDTTTTAPVTPDATASTTTTTPPADNIPDWAKDPVAAAKMVADLRAENARDRTAAKDAAAKEARETLLKQLGLQPDDKPVTPEAHQQALAERDARIKALTIKSALTDALSTQNAKPIARAAVLGDGVLDGLDHTAADFNEQVSSKVAAYLSANSDLKATGQAPASSATDAPGGSGGAKPTYTRAQIRDTAFYQANKADIDAAAYDGRITD